MAMLDNEPRYAIGERVREFPSGKQWRIVQKHYPEIEDDRSHTYYEARYDVLVGEKIISMGERNIISERENPFFGKEITLWSFSWGWHGPGLQAVTGVLEDDYWHKFKYTFMTDKRTYDHMTWGEEAFFTKEEAIAEQLKELNETCIRAATMLLNFRDKYGYDGEEEQG